MIQKNWLAVSISNDTIIGKVASLLAYRCSATLFKEFVDYIFLSRSSISVGRFSSSLAWSSCFSSFTAVLLPFLACWMIATQYIAVLLSIIINV